jgi:hypothetical protein
MASEAAVIDAHDRHAQDVRFTKDGKLLVSVGQDARSPENGTSCLYNLADRKCPMSLFLSGQALRLRLGLRFGKFTA